SSRADRRTTPALSPTRQSAATPSGILPSCMGGDTLERDRELARLTAALGDAAGGAGSLVVIEGPPGIGKTRLIAEVREQAKRDGFGRLHAVGDEPERSVPWGAVRQLVERSVLRYAGATREAILAG